MPPPHLQQTRKAKAQILVALFLLVSLLALHPVIDLLSGRLKPIVLTVMSVWGFKTADLGAAIQIGHIELGWTRDCAGINQLLLLLALVIWMRRRDFWHPATLWVCLLTLPAALLANIMRVLTLIAYRLWFYPQQESPELHYFMGFFWLLPLAALFLPAPERRQGRRWIELAQAASVMALLAPLLGAAEGIAMGVAAVLVLAKSQVPGIWTNRRLLGIAAWILLGIGIATVRMESFWLPWLLISPLCAKREWLKQPRSLLLIAASHPLFDLLPLGGALIWCVIAWTLWIEYLRPLSSPASSPPAENHRPAKSLWVTTALTAGMLMLCAPFTAFLFIPEPTELPRPPADATILPLTGQGFELRLPSAPPEIGIFWYPPKNYDRHHTLKVCMTYSGAPLKRIADSDNVWQGNGLYYREFFLQNQTLLDNHKDYVWATLGAWASPGIHLVFAVRQSDMPAGTFETVTAQLAARLQNTIQ